MVFSSAASGSAGRGSDVIISVIDCLLSSVQGYKPIEGSEEKDMAAPWARVVRATSLVTRYAGQALEPERDCPPGVRAGRDSTLAPVAR